MLGFGNKRQRPAAGGYREQGNGYTPPQSQTAGYQGGYQNTQMGQPQTAEYPGGYQNAQQMGQFAGYGEDQQDLQELQKLTLRSRNFQKKILILI